MGLGLAQLALCLWQQEALKPDASAAAALVHVAQHVQNVACGAVACMLHHAAVGVLSILMQFVLCGLQRYQPYIWQYDYMVLFGRAGALLLLTRACYILRGSCTAMQCMLGRKPASRSCSTH